MRAEDIIAGLSEAQRAALIDAMIAEIEASDLEAATIGDPEWRIDNLYYIQDKSGREVKFVRNPAQRDFWRSSWYLNVILKARQLGFSTLIAMIILDTCLFTPNTAAGIIDFNIDDAKKKLGKISFAYERLPEKIRAQVPLINDNKEMMQFGNGSRVEVGVSHRGGTLQILHVSEFGKISAQRPDKAREIKRGGFGTVQAGQRIYVESTSEGTFGEFYEMIQAAEKAAAEGAPLSMMDFRLQFFGWHRDAEYRIDAAGIIVTAEIEEYFAELRARHGIVCDRAQIAWYQAMFRRLGWDGMYHEYPSVPEEAFKASLEGAYFRRQMTKMRQDGRIGDVPYDDGRLVNTFWDIGNDCTSIWFHQTDGVRHRLIDYYENADEPITHYVRTLWQKRQDFGWTFGKHYGPHDLAVSDWGGAGKSRYRQAEDMGLRFTVVPRIEDKDDAIDAARMFLGMCWIDAKHCARGINCLDNYRKKWNDQLGAWSGEPLHNWASHGADSLQQGAMGYRPERAKPAPERIKKLPNLVTLPRDQGTGWMAR
jgi:hypothetical protein